MFISLPQKHITCKHNNLFKDSYSSSNERKVLKQIYNKNISNDAIICTKYNVGKVEIENFLKNLNYQFLSI